MLAAPDDRERWNARHARSLAEGTVDATPAEWLAEREALFAARAPGRALDVACGLGRHALWLARLGFTVDAVDVADIAVAHVAAMARERGLSVRASREELRAPGSLPEPPYDAIVVVHFLDRDLLPRFADALAPGGLLAVEAFLAHPGADWGPSNPDHVLAPGELPRLLGGLDVVHADEAPYRGRRKARVLAVRVPEPRP